MSTSTNHPNKRHDGKYLTLIAMPGTLDEGTRIHGRYEHRDRRTTFSFHIGDRRAVLQRDEWAIEPKRKPAPRGEHRTHMLEEFRGPWVTRRAPGAKPERAITKIKIYSCDYYGKGPHLYAAVYSTIETAGLRGPTSLISTDGNRRRVADKIKRIHEARAA